MKRHCNLELRLVTPSVNFHSSDYNERSRMESSGSPNEKQQQMTIFYNGRVAACDVTEHQARSIIFLASGEKASKKSDMTINYGGSEIKSPVCSPPTTLTSGLHMKRSLQRFLEKRKTRAQAISPYPTHATNHNINHS